MKEKLRRRPVLAGALHRLAAAVPARADRLALRSGAGGFLAALLLAGVRLWNRPLPLSACLLPACTGAARTGALLGALAGYALFWGAAGALEPLAVTALLALALLLRPRRRSVWLLPCAAMAASALVGMIFVVDGRFSVPALGHWAACVALAGGAAVLWRQAVTYRQEHARLLLGAALLLGLRQLPLPGGLSAAVAALAWAACAPGWTGLLAAALGGAALQLTAPAQPVAAIFCLYALLDRSLRGKPPVLQLAARAACCLLGALTLPSGQPGFAASALAGLLASFPLPPRAILPETAPAAPPERSLAGRALEQTAGALEQARSLLSGALDASRELDAAEAFDRAAEQVCRSCASWEGCWERAAEQTYAALCAAAPAILARGQAQREDFPPEFREQCQRISGFSAAVSAALDEQLSKRQYVRRLREQRQALAGQYGILSCFCRDIAARQARPAEPPVNFHVNVAARGAGRGDSAISGDRGASFPGPEATHYVLLCDGMGSGPAAARESAAAIRLLTGLLQAGMEPCAALRTLNTVYLLRDNGCFSTVDLLRLNLTSADAILYKWGAAPSYLRHRRGVRTLGSGTVPPGLSQGGEPEQLRLSLLHGELLVLVSDGAAGEDTRQRLAHYDGGDPLELAAYLLAGAQARSEDDCTVVAVRLEPCE